MTTPVSRLIASRAAPRVAQWLVGLMRLIEERVPDDVARWELLRQSLEQIGSATKGD